MKEKADTKALRETVKRGRWDEGPKVLNRREEREVLGDPQSVYVGRPTKWGNPYHMGIHGTREEVIQRYRDWLLDNEELMRSLSELRGRDLSCWCAPLPCHADVLLELANR